MGLNEQAFGEGTIIQRRADSLKIHPEAQRRMVASQLKKIRNNLDLDGIGVLYAVDYPIEEAGVTKDGPWIIDGQTRLRALCDEKCGEWIVHVYVYKDVKTHQRACDLFLLHNESTKVGPFDKFENAVTAGRSDAASVLAILGRQQLEPRRYRSDGGICCVTTLMRWSEVKSGRPLEDAIETAIHSWGRGALAVEGRLVDALARVYSRNNGTVDKDRLTVLLSKYSGGPGGLLGAGKGVVHLMGTTLGNAIAELIIRLYNKGVRVKGKRLRHVL